ncbi:MAG: hypothetical protein GX605_02455 [Chloroflexi bacterium]|nr:hypothetical protein [Chloroflexota bacterium]
MLVRLATAGAAAALVWLGAALAARAGGRPVRVAFSLPSDSFALSLLAAGALWWLARPAPLPAYALWGAALALTLTPPLAATAWLRGPWGWVGRPRLALALALTLSGAAAVFLWKFPAAAWGQLLFFDDYPTIYASSLEGLKALTQGGLFGWNSRLLGGYYTVSDVNHNLALFLLPFVAAGPRLGYHLLIAAAALAFPVLLTLWARQTLQGRGAAAVAAYLAGFFFLTVMDSLLHWGMLNSLLGLDLLLLNLLGWERLRAGRAWSVFPLAFTLGLTVYAHVGFFLYSLLFLGLEFLWQPSRRLASRLALAGLGAAAISLPMTVHYLLYPGFFVESNEAWARQAPAWGEVLRRSLGNLAAYADLNAWLALPVKGQALCLITLPALAWAALRGPAAARRAALYAALVMALAALELPGLTLALQRMRFVLPVFLAAVWAAWAWDARTERPRWAALLFLAALLWAAWPQRATWPATHLPALREFHPALMDQVAALPTEGWVLWEAQSSYDTIDDAAVRSPHGPVQAHLEALLTLETDHRYMTLIQEGYHHSVYRGNVLNAGGFRGQAIGQIPLAEVRAFLDRWGVTHLVLWSEPSQQVFAAAPQWFRLLWQEPPWALYAYLGAESGDVLPDSGTGRLEGEGPFGFQVALEGVRAGDTVVVRQNAFPAWRAHWAGGAVPLWADDERLAFQAPADGSYAVSFRYPRYRWASLLALGTAAAGLASGAAGLWKRKRRRP